MRILGLLKADAQSEAGAPPSAELIERMGTFIEEVTKAGVLLDTDGLKPSSQGKRVAYANGKATVIDGPFTESKELVASYAVFQVQTWDDAIRWTTRFLEVLGEGEVELRPIFEPTDFPPEIFSPEAAAHEAGVREEMQRNAGR
jgi:hypothetical protein